MTLWIQNNHYVELRSQGDRQKEVAHFRLRITQSGYQANSISVSRDLPHVIPRLVNNIPDISRL